MILVPKKKEMSIEFKYYQTQDEIVNYLKIYKYTDGIIETRQIQHLFNKVRKDTKKNTSYQVILIKQVKIDSKTFVWS